MEITVLTLVVDEVGGTEQKSLNIDYDITSGSVDGIISDVNTKSMMINITAPDSGTLNITIPRSIIDSKSSWDVNIDDIFLMLLDGEEMEYVEESYQTTASDSRTLEIPYVIGSEVIEIIGTSVIEDLYTIGDGIAVAIDIGM